MPHKRRRLHSRDRRSVYIEGYTLRPRLLGVGSSSSKCSSRTSLHFASKRGPANRRRDDECPVASPREPGEMNAVFSRSEIHPAGINQVPFTAAFPSSHPSRDATRKSASSKNIEISLEKIA